MEMKRFVATVQQHTFLKRNEIFEPPTSWTLKRTDNAKPQERVSLFSKDEKKLLSKQRVSLRKTFDKRIARNVRIVGRASARRSVLLLVLVARIKSLDIPPRGPRERTIETFSTTTRVAHTRGVLVTESPVASCMLGNLSRARLQKAAAI